MMAIFLGSFHNIRDRQFLCFMVAPHPSMSVSYQHRQSLNPSLSCDSGLIFSLLFSSCLCLVNRKFLQSTVSKTHAFPTSFSSYLAEMTVALHDEIIHQSIKARQPGRRRELSKHEHFWVPDSPALINLKFPLPAPSPGALGCVLNALRIGL